MIEGLRRLSERINDVASSAPAAQPTKDNDWPQSAAIACSEWSGAAREIRFNRDLIGLAGLADLHDKVVLDVGSGFGLSLVTYALLGAREAHGIDYAPEVVDAVARYLPKLPRHLAGCIHNRHRDAAAIPYAPNTFDILFSVEAVSHYLHVKGFLAEAARVLKPGGLLLISDGNNRANRSWYIGLDRFGKLLKKESQVGRLESTSFASHIATCAAT